MTPYGDDDDEGEEKHSHSNIKENLLVLLESYENFSMDQQQCRSLRLHVDTLSFHLPDELNPNQERHLLERNANVLERFVRSKSRIFHLHFDRFCFYSHFYFITETMFAETN